MGGGVTRILAAMGMRGFPTYVQYDLGNQWRQRHLYGHYASRWLPRVYIHSEQRQRFCFWHPGKRQPVLNGRTDECRQRQCVQLSLPNRVATRPIAVTAPPAARRPMVARSTTLAASTSPSHPAIRMSFTPRRNPSIGTAPAVAATPAAANSARGPVLTAARPGAL